MGLHRGLAIAFVVLSAVYVGLATWLATGSGPATSAFEGVRRYDEAFRRGRPDLAAHLGQQALALAIADRNWSTTQVAAFEAELAGMQLAARNPGKALSLARSASDRLANESAANLSLVIDLAHTHAGTALAAGNALEAVCVYGVLLERIGPDRVATAEPNAKTAPELAELALHLVRTGQNLRGPEAAIAPDLSADQLLPSCQLLADFYFARKDYKAAALASDLVVAAARTTDHLTPEIRAALLEASARSYEFLGDVRRAEERLTEAVDVLAKSNNSIARLHALEALGTFLSSWGESERALPVLERAMALHEAQDAPNPNQLASTLLALGYVQLDGGDTVAAETTFKRALGFSNSNASPNLPAAREALTALGDLYDDQGREADAIKAKQEAAAIEAADALGRGRKLAEAQRSRPETVRTLTLRIPFHATGTPTGGRGASAFSSPAATTTAGEVAVTLPAPMGIHWAPRWPKDRFEFLAKSPALYGTGEPQAASEVPLKQGIALYVSGAGTAFSAGAERAARLQAAIGPDASVVLLHWANASGARGYLRNDFADARARSLVADFVQELGAVAPESPLSLVLEGRAARHFYEILKRELLPVEVKQRLAAIALLAPQLAEAEMVSLAAQVDPARTRLVVYAAERARPLLAARDVYREEPIGLRLTPIAGLKTAEWIAIGIDQQAADFDTLIDDALLRDLSSVLRGGPPATKRCGLARVSEGRAGDAFALNPRGCDGDPSGVR